MARSGWRSLRPPAERPRPIVAADFSPARRALAARMGADVVIDPATTPVQDMGRARADDGGREGRAAAGADVAAGVKPASSSNASVCPADPADLRGRTARCAHRGCRRLHGDRPSRADARHHEGIERAIRARLYASGIRMLTAAPRRGQGRRGLADHRQGRHRRRRAGFHGSGQPEQHTKILVEPWR